MPRDTNAIMNMLKVYVVVPVDTCQDDSTKGIRTRDSEGKDCTELGLRRTFPDL